MDFALNNIQWLICHKTKTKPIQQASLFKYISYFHKKKVYEWLFY